MELGQMLAQSGKVVDLGRETYEVHGHCAVTGDRTITGNGAVIKHFPHDERWCPCLIVRGTGTRLEGDVRIVGRMPDGNRYDSDREAHHGIEVQSATDTFIGPWMVTNVFGDGVYVGKRDRGHPWTQNLTLDGTRFDECGRCSLSMQAVDGALATNLNIQRSNMSVLDMEPNAADWGAKNFTWTNSLVRDHGGGFVVACLGQGRTNSVMNIRLDGISCPNRVFNMNVRPPEGTRRANFSVSNCTGGETSGNTPLRFTRVDGITIKNVRQPCADKVRMVNMADCTHWDVPGSRSPNPPPEF
jgi:hypothetical protein